MAHQAESIPESLKNVLLVMNQSGVLVDPTSTASMAVHGHDHLWDITWLSISKFLPNLRHEVRSMS